MIDLPESVIKKIAANLVSKDLDAHRVVKQAIQNESGEGTYNSKGWVELDTRYNGLLPIAKEYNLIPVLIKRGCQIIALYNSSSNHLYLFLKDKTLREQFKKDSKTYYVKVLNLFNIELDSIEPLNKQLSFLPEDSDSSNSELELLELARKLLRNSQQDPSKVFVFSYDNQRVIPQVNAMAFNTSQEIVWRKDYSYLLDSDYDADMQPDGIKGSTKESTTPTKAKNTENKKQIVKLKTN